MNHGVRSSKYGTLAVVVALILAACAGSASADSPPDLNLGRDVCERCGMIIEDERFASGYRLPDGTQHLFDDIGGMLLWAGFAGHIDDARMWVHDYDSKEWIEAAQATFVFSPELMTPMAFGIAAFSTPEAAVAFSTNTDGVVRAWNEVAALAKAGDIQLLGGAGAAGSGS